MSSVSRVFRSARPRQGSPGPGPTALGAVSQEEINGVLLSRLLASTKTDPSLGLQGFEHRVFSQFGDDGIIAYLTSFVPAECRRFAEFGVEDYSESNTRLLMTRDNWSGLVIDGSQAHIDTIRGRKDFWRYDLTAVAAFVTAESIGPLFEEHGYTGRLGLLSVDIDGADYWVLKALTAVEPLILVCEYISAFGPTAPITVPYDPAFRRLDAHYSGLYAGASLAALTRLAAERGLRLVGSNSAGNNAYFVHPSLGVPLPTLSPAEAHVPSRFREARGADGQMLLRRADECLELIADMPVVNVETSQTISVREALAL
ncbi:hypothetical protein Pla175_39220 [Pirellulimonas nuda]|uniref:Methyltransferase FkbM domain-containing protein n=1 Tax=Pirellulimonas nuda TaxID=2528009 RepID=A0A518DGB7_9BACT|nr:hypothetical protein [Pirellulimonas nuda]QDU90516.1 hypothetical protein Pla175_39220 [Pirellulimonas nuda]